MLCFTGNVHLPWKDHCLLQLGATRSAKERGNVTGQWLSGKWHNTISTSASQLDLFCLMTHMGKAVSFRTNQGLAAEYCWFSILASTIYLPAWNCQARGSPMAPQRIWRQPKNVSRSNPFLHTKMASPESSKEPMEESNRAGMKCYP